MSPEKIHFLIKHYEIPPERVAKFTEKVWLIWEERLETFVIAEQALGFPQVKKILEKVKKG